MHSTLLPGSHRAALAGTLLLVLALPATADSYDWSGGIPFTAQTAGNSFYDQHPLITTTLLPVGSVLDPLYSSYFCAEMSAEQTVEALWVDDPRLLRAREDAAAHLASDGRLHTAQLQAAFVLLRGLRRFEQADSRLLAQLLLLLPDPPVPGRG